MATLTKENAVLRVTELAQGGYDLFFNLCDGARDEPRPGIEVVETLERLGQAYTGADPSFFEPSREAMKRVCAAWGLGTPCYVLARAPGDVARAALARRARRGRPWEVRPRPGSAGGDHVSDWVRRKRSEAADP